MALQEPPHSGVLLAGKAEESVDRMLVPGATTSGLIRWSSVGPREENAAIPSMLSDM